jgi:hypothetical protein
MDSTYKLRAMMTGMGALAALALFTWFEIANADLLASRPLMFGAVATGVFFGALLAISPRMALPHAAGFALAQGVAVAGLILLASLRYDQPVGMIESAFPVYAALILCWLPLPFFIAHARGNWRDYAALFEQAWDIALRFGIGLLLAGTVWLLIFLSDVLLSLVGLGFLDMIWDIGPAAYVITGAAGGFGIGVAAETMAAAGARLALMLLRPLLPLILAVVAVFLVALPFRGLSTLFGALSAGMTLMVISAVAAKLVTAVVDARGEAASRSRVLAVSARFMSGLMLILGVLAVVAVAQRVLQYGWTPARIYAALGALVSLGYGISYAAEALRGDWMARIRRANVTMALALIALAALTLTPVLNAERISSRSQMARFADGRAPVERLDIRAFEGWGIAGKAALDDLREQSRQAGQEALAARIFQRDFVSGVVPLDMAALRAKVAAMLPLQPASATAMQKFLLQGIKDYNLIEVQAACARQTGDLGKSCVMIVGDFLTDVAGEEGLVALIDADGELRTIGLRQDASTGKQARTSLMEGVDYPNGKAAIAAIRAWQAAPPVLSPAPIMQIPLGAGGVILLPD